MKINSSFIRNFAGPALSPGLAISCILLSCVMTASGCSKSSAPSAGNSYSFTSATNVSIALGGASLLEALQYKGLESVSGMSAASTGPTLCTSVACITPSALTGKYLGTGFSIQSNGNGMVAYFGQENWSSITGTSTAFDFDTTSPITNAGTLSCCGGTGDLTSANTYIESIIYLFGYLDAKFTLDVNAYQAGGNTSMNGVYTVRFVLATGAITNALRGDLQIKPPGATEFYWLDLDGTTTSGAYQSVSADAALVLASAARPTHVATMDSKITAYVNPFSTALGNQTIPVIYAPVLTSSGTGVYQVTETELKTVGKTYTYTFDPKNFVMFPSLTYTHPDGSVSAADHALHSLYSLKTLLTNIHLGGLPSSINSGVGNPAGTKLVVTSP